MDKNSSNSTKSDKNALKKADDKVFYENRLNLIDLKTKLVQLRKAAKLTQDEVAKRMNTSKPQISRLESANSYVSPTIATLQSYARAVGCKLEINFTQLNESDRLLDFCYNTKKSKRNTK